jgi:hypothetical protein
MALRCLLFGLLVGTTACGSEEPYCGFPPQWRIAVTDDPAPLTPESAEPVARLDVRATERCQPSLALDEFYVTFDTPARDIGKTTRANYPENLLLMELVDENEDARLGAREALLLREGPVAVVPPGIEWEIWLMIGDEGEGGGAGMARADVLIE